MKCLKGNANQLNPQVLSVPVTWSLKKKKAHNSFPSQVGLRGKVWQPLHWEPAGQDEAASWCWFLGWFPT